jgi:hypothetical protein
LVIFAIGDWDVACHSVDVVLDLVDLVDRLDLVIQWTLVIVLT